MTDEFARRLNDILQNLGNAVNGVIEAQNAAAVANAAAAAAQMAAETAQIAADNAASSSSGNAEAQSLAISGIMPRVVLSANAAGTITVASHTRYYGDGTSVPVSGGTITGQSVGDTVYVYYEDPMRTGGAVAYQPDTAFQTQSGSRHNVGSVTIPATGSSPGEPGPTPPGG